MPYFCHISLVALIIGRAALAAQPVHAVKVPSGPVIDGRADDAVWSKAPVLTTRDSIGDIEMSLRVLYTDTRVFVLVSYPDENESRSHKEMYWDESLEVYKTGPSREDTIVLKWNMESEPVDLSLSSDTPYRADIWYWKAGRTDHAGYADDKMHVYESLQSPDARQLISKSGETFYLERPGDQGRSAYAVHAYGEYVGDEVPKYARQKPLGSRGDVQAKGHWENGRWTIEFARLLDTGHADDVPFDPHMTYQFGVSRYEIAGRQPDSRASQPFHGAGEIGEELLLVYR